MSVLNGLADAKTEISAAGMAFVGRLTSANLTMSTRSLPSTNYYRLQFEDNIKSLKGAVPMTTEFDFQQICRFENFIREDGTKVAMSERKEPESGRYYVAIYNSNEYTIETLIEINEKDVSSLLQKES